MRGVLFHVSGPEETYQRLQIDDLGTDQAKAWRANHRAFAQAGRRNMPPGQQLRNVGATQAAGAAMSDNSKRPKRRHIATGRPRGGHLQPDGSREHLYSVELADEICRRIADGETLYEVCEDPAIPVSASAVRQWDLDDRDGFSAKYASAKRQLIEAWSDQLVRIADNDLLEPNDGRVRIDTRKWLMSKLHPGKYGDKVTVAGDAANPLQHVVRALDLTKLSGPELDALERFANARLAAVEVEADSKDPEEQN